MNSRTMIKSALPVAATTILALAGCQSDLVSYSAEVKPILDRYCLECHQPGGAGHEASGLDMSGYENLMLGTSNGPMVIPGDSMGSNLLVLMEGRADPAIRMPHNSHEKVSLEEIEKIRLWIDQGAENN